MWVSVCMRKQQCVSQWQLEAESELLALTFGTCAEYKVRNLHEHEILHVMQLRSNKWNLHHRKCCSS